MLMSMLLLNTTEVSASETSAVNKFDTGVVNIEISEFTLDEKGKEVPWVDGIEVMPGMRVSKIPYFTATGNDCYIRVTLTIEEGFDVNHPITIDDLYGISDNWIRIGEYFYYKYPLKTNESIDFFHGFEIPREWDDSVNPANVGEWKGVLSVRVDAVQAENFTPDFESTNPWMDVAIQDSIHKKGYDVNVFKRNKITDLGVIVEDINRIIVKPNDFFEGFKTMVPGDVLSDEVTIKSKEHCEVFFSTESLKDIDLLQEMRLQIVLKKDGAEKVVYDGVLDVKLDKTSLGVFEKGEKAEMVFTVSMPKELDNQYVLRDAAVKWIFETRHVSNGNPVTGDKTSVSSWLVASSISGTIVLLLPQRIWRGKYEKNKE